MNGLVDRLAAAPITWGVDASSWGVVMPRDRMIREMKSVGLTRTELGPDGYLPQDPEELAAYLQSEGVSVIGGWVPVPMAFQQSFDNCWEYLNRACAQLQRAGADVLVLGPLWDKEDYVKPRNLTDDEWRVFLANLSTVRRVAEDHGLTTALHQHVGTAVQDEEDLQRVLDGSDVGLCVDTGHMMSCGIDPVSFVQQYPDRVAHVHLKDMRSNLAARVRSKDLDFVEAVKKRLFLPLGQGDARIAEFVLTLESAGYQGWYTIEQDCSLAEIPDEGTGPVEDCRISYDYLVELSVAQAL